MPKSQPRDRGNARTKGQQDSIRKASAGKKGAEGREPRSEERLNTVEDTLGGDFNQGTFERHAAILGHSRMSQPTYARQRVRIMRELQRDYGNRYVQRLVDHIQTKRAEAVQAKPTVGSGGDESEQGLGRVAKQVLSIPLSTSEGPAQRQDEEGLETKPLLQRRDETVDRHSPSAPAPTPTVLEDEGNTGDEKVEGQLLEIEEKSPSLDDGEVNEWGEIEGVLGSDVVPKVFVDDGKTGSGIVNWVGGPGGTGNQAVGSITLMGPVYEGMDPATDGMSATAWIRPGTGTATVTRSYQGVLVGANGKNYYFTDAAAARVDVHEQLHVNTSLAIHDANLAPLEERIAQHTGQDHAKASGSDANEAIAALQAYIDWNAAITNFRTVDITANRPMGTVDVDDQAAPDSIRDYGPRAVDGANYTNYIDIPPGP